MIKIKKPTVLIDEARVRKNIMKMIHKAENSQVQFRPHFKTHQSIEIGNWFKEYGITSITVSSVDMANYFAKNGWNDITIAVPCNLNQIEEIDTLAREVLLHVLVDSIETSQYIAENITSKVNIWIEIDVNSHRSGIQYENRSDIKNIVKILEKADLLNFTGILTHAGNSYNAESYKELNQIHKDTIKKMTEVKDYLEDRFRTDVKISIGDTPTCSIIDDFSGVDEIRPGNFVFYDLTQLKLGVCEESDIAIAVACPVISKSKIRNEIVIYGGAIHLSKDSLIWSNNTRIYGKVSFLNQGGWDEFLPDTNVINISQEHGVIKVSKDMINRIDVGDVVAIIPIHSCLTANLCSNMYSINGAIFTSFRY